MQTLLSSGRPSERKFGLTFAAIFIALSAYGAFASWRPIVCASLVVAGVAFAIAATVAPHRLAALNKVWFAFGELLGRVVSPVVLGLIFFVLITPVAVVMRWSGRDELRLRRRAVVTHWIPRSTRLLDPDSFTQQF